ncbi:beta-propeller fold lactonase family protein [Bradyrhizobium sp. 83002]|uniref:lactonase family protein n=1 Tax=Bradyrhizobium aeschynomenes TaxID=2734909 RepID=UPI001557E921|nr:beta-propeller fold lactonase family protein [Bradyrhizobium aeschynomenes]NPU09407.1 beta-propeller fold lactonase family protein [Bradyrhizobium aeschynomenes]
MIRSGTIMAATFVLAAAATLAPRAVSAETYAYVGNADSNDISVFKFDATTGEMTLVQTAAFAGVEKPGSSTPLAISPDRRVLVAGVRSQPFQAESFAIDGKTGQLTHIGNGPLADSMANIAFDRTGKVLFSASYGGNKVAVNPLQANGVVGAPSQVIPTGLNAHAILPSPDNRFVFATNLGSDQVLGFAFDAATGTLTAKDARTVKTPEKSGPRHFIFHPNGKFIYLLHELNADLAVYAYDADKGTWREQQRITTLPPGFTGKPWAADLHATPDGTFLYTSERGSNTLAAFKIDAASGRVTVIGSVPTETQPRGFAIDPTGRHLAAVGEVSNGMTVYRIDATSGALEKVKSYAVGKKPNWVEFVSLP